MTTTHEPLPAVINPNRRVTEDEAQVEAAVRDVLKQLAGNEKRQFEDECVSISKDAFGRISVYLRNAQRVAVFSAFGIVHSYRPGCWEAYIIALGQAARLRAQEYAELAESRDTELFAPIDDLAFFQERQAA